MQFLAEYGLFLMKAITLVAAILIVIAGVIALASKGKSKDKQKLEIEKINDKYKEMHEHLNAVILTKHQLKEWEKQEKKAAKAEKKACAAEHKTKKRIFVTDFDGDIKASAVSTLRQAVTAILTVATPQDEVVLRLESGGGLVHAYGLAASQLQRIRERKIPLTIAIDKVAASGGYMMACVGNRVLAAPFAIVGSIGVLAQLPNFHRLLKKNDIDYEQITAGEYKRTLTLFGENTEKGRHKFQEEVEETQVLFKDFVKQHRSVVDIDKVATGEHWYGTQALELKLVDEIMTSDDYLLNNSRTSDIYLVNYIAKKNLANRIATSMELLSSKGLSWWHNKQYL